MGGLAGFMGTYLIGPRVGKFYDEKELAFILEDEAIENPQLNEALERYQEKLE